MKFTRFFIFLLMLLLLKSNGSKAIGMHCATVAGNGSVTFSWDLTGAVAGNFHCYYIYSSTTAGGPFTAIDSVFIYNTTTYTDINANAYNVPAFYYIAELFSNGNPAIVSDTIRAIGLNVANPGVGYANLSWPAVHLPLIPSNSIWYKIYREYPAGVFTLIDSVNASTAPSPMTYSDQISVCDDTIKYRIEVTDQSGCVSVSPVKGDRFRDLQPPPIGTMDSVSVDAAGNATIAWEMSTVPDASFYVILQSITGVWTPIDTVDGRPNTVLYSLANCQSQAESFQIITVDSCSNPSAQSDFMRTIYLTSSFDICSKSISLSWNGYSYWPVPPLYQVWRSINGAPEVLIGTTNSTSFLDTNLVSNQNFCYRIRAVDQTAGVSRSSTSNQSCLLPSYPPPPAFSYIRTVTVTSSSNVRIVGYVDATAKVSAYKLYRATSAAGPFGLIGTLAVTGVSTITFNDNVDASNGPYYYKIETFDSCGVLAKVSQISRTILLTGVANSDYTNSMTWTSYSDWLSNIDRYNVYRSYNGVLDPTPIAAFVPGDSTFSDYVLNEFETNGTFCYIVEAIEGNLNPYLFQDTSRSNEICLTQTPMIFLPNAFRPGGGYNDIFIPGNAFVSADGYSLYIFDRWGEKVFQSDDPTKGWDGSINGRPAPMAVYVYLLNAKMPDGSKIERKGSVTLIR